MAKLWLSLSLSRTRTRKEFQAHPSHLMLNNTHRENCVLFNSLQEFIEIETWLFLTFYLCLQNQSVSIHSIVTH